MRLRRIDGAAAEGVSNTPVLSAWTLPRIMLQTPRLHLAPDASYPFDARSIAKRFRHSAIFGVLDALRAGETMRSSTTTIGCGAYRLCNAADFTEKCTSPNSPRSFSPGTASAFQ